LELAIPPGGAAADGAAAESERLVSGTKIQAMMALLLEEGQFLVDTKVKEALAMMGSEEEAQLAQVESMLRALGVDTEEDVKTLVEFFFPPSDDEEDLDGLEAELPETVLALKKLISPEKVTAAIGSFVEAKKLAKLIGGAPRPAGAGAAGGEASAAAGGGGGGGSSEGRREEKEYWVRAASVISDDTLLVWSQLEKSLVAYNKVLAERSDAIAEVQSLQNKNESLKELLHTYLGARVNEELIVPPNQTIQGVGF
jgi:hypothetical protein